MNITDDYIIDHYFIGNIINKNATRHIQKHPEVVQYLNHRFKENRNPIDYTEIIYRIKHNLEEIPKCPICGKIKKYRTCRGPYGDKTCGDKNCMCIHMEQTFISTYGGLSGFGNSTTIKQIQKTINNKYCANNVMQSDIFINSHKFKYISKEEQILGSILLDLYHDTLMQYKSKDYNHRCDFYIPSLNLYIEYNGSYYHHGHVYNSNDIDDQNELCRLREKQQDSCIKVWTVSDLQKINDAKQNHINYLVIYPLFLSSSRNIMRRIFKNNKEQIKEFLFNYIETFYRNNCNIFKIIGEDK